MVDAILGIADFIMSIIHFIGNTLASIIWVVTSIPQFVGTVTGLFAYCPTPLLIFLEMSLALMILFAIIKLL